MKYAAISERLKGLGAAKWELHVQARSMKAQGQDVIELTIGEPDVPTPAGLLDMAKSAIDQGRLGYSSGRGEAKLLAALAAKYSASSGRNIGSDQFVALPGTQTALFAVMMTLLGPGDEVIVGDPMYATYEGIIAATGAKMVPVPLRPEAGFRLQATDVAARITPRTRVLFLNSPHNPTGSVLTRDDVLALGRLSKLHDLWIVSDEVYEELVFAGARFHSPLQHDDLSDRVIVTSSISKSHAAAGFRSGWALGPAEFVERMLPLAEAMLFGNQPFIADMTALAVSQPSEVARGMAERFARRADLVRQHLDGVRGLRVPSPEAGMFALVDVRATGLTGVGFARSLLTEQGVAVMPGESFGTGLGGWLRLSLTKDDATIATACKRIAAFVQDRMGAAA